jgi:1-acyl-sn-glycerol-3-phosphate acyltransferase
MSEAQPLTNILSKGAHLLSPREQALIRFVRKTFEPGPADKSIRVMQRALGSFWIEHCTRNVRNVHGLTRLPNLDPKKSYILVSNHRSFFDLYLITSYLVYRDLLPHRILFPVRSNFFYDSYGGLAVNGMMSFFAMYPPIFRERKRLRLNEAALDEVSTILNKGGFFVGLHPEGMRNLGDPYELLPARYGVGRIIADSNAVVIPAFVNGLGNDIAQQVKGNFNGKGDDVHVVFGEPLDFSELLAQRRTRKLEQRISEKALDAIRALGEEERIIRARH